MRRAVIVHILIFDGLITACCGYALWRGGPPERIVGGSLFLAYLATLASYTSLATRFVHIEAGAFAVDLLLLALLIAVALRADRAWPLVLAGLQLDTVSAHLLKVWDLNLIRVTYALMLAGWSYPMLIALAVGTWRYQRRLRRKGCDQAWTPSRARKNVGKQASINATSSAAPFFDARR